MKLNLFIKSNTFGDFSYNHNYIFIREKNENIYSLKIYDWNFNLVGTSLINNHGFHCYKDFLIVCEIGNSTTCYLLEQNSGKTIKKLNFWLLFISNFFYKNYYIGKVSSGLIGLFDIDKNQVIKIFPHFDGVMAICNNFLVFTIEQQSNIWKDTKVGATIVVVDKNNFNILWKRDLYDYCTFKVEFSNNLSDGNPTLIKIDDNKLLLLFKAHILCLNIETGETIWHIEDRYKEVEVIDNRCYLDKWVGYDVVDVHTGKKLQDFVKFSPIILGEDFTYTTPTNGESRYYKGYIWRTTRYEREGSETLLVIEPTTGKYVHIEKIPAKSMLNAPQFMEDKVILTSRSEAEFFIYQISDFDSLEK